MYYMVETDGNGLSFPVRKLNAKNIVAAMNEAKNKQRLENSCLIISKWLSEDGHHTDGCLVMSTEDGGWV